MSGLRWSLRLKFALALVSVTTLATILFTVQTRSSLTGFAEASLRLRADELISFLEVAATSSLLAQDLGSVNDLVSGLATKSDVDLVVIANEDGVIVASSAQNKLGRPITELVPAASSELRRRELAIAGSSQPIGTVHVELNRRALIEAESQLTRTMLLAGLLVVGLSIVVSVLLSRQMTLGLLGVVRSAQAIATGDLTTATPGGSNDETGDLSVSFEAMREALIRLVGRSREGVGSIRVAMRVSTELAAANRQVTDQVTSSTQRTVAGIHQLTTTTERTRERAEMMLTLSQASETAVSQGLAAADSSIQQMEQLVSQIAGLSTQTQQVADAMRRVERVNATVSELARQAHLVSVNARLEATRAAESGRTFSEVAGQMRSLADNSRDGARRVQELLGEIQRTFGEVVQTVNAAQRRAGEAGTVAADARRTLNGMGGALKEFADAARAIATSAQEQQAGTTELARSSSEIRQAIEQLVKAFQEMAGAVVQVDAFSADLSELVGSYRVPALVTRVVQVSGR
jgi:methyl-accepting chemotaxis protein